MGQIIGGAMAVVLLSLFYEWAIFKRVLDDPRKGAFASVVAAYFTAVTLAGFGMANGGPWTPAGFLIYAPGAVIVLVSFLWRIHKNEQANSDY